MAAPPDKLTPREVARKAARARWGAPRVLRLDTLTPDQRRIVLAFVEMGKADPPDTAPEAA